MRPWRGSKRRRWKSTAHRRESAAFCGSRSTSIVRRRAEDNRTWRRQSVRAARCIASREACRILKRSISKASAAPTAQATRALADSLGQHFAALGLELLAVVEAANRTCRIEHHSRREHRAEQRPAAGFVQSGDGPVTGASGRRARSGWSACRRTAVSSAVIRVRAGGRLCPSVRAGNTAWRGGRARCAPHRCDRPPERAPGRYARRPGRS